MLNWINLTIRNIEWSIAERVLFDKDGHLKLEGYKLKRGEIYPDNHGNPHQLTHSFLGIQNKIIAIGHIEGRYHQNDTEKKPFSARIKYAEEKDCTHDYVLKIEAIKIPDKTTVNRNPISERELGSLAGAIVGGITRSNAKGIVKGYALYTDFGPKSLWDFIRTKPAKQIQNIDEAYRIAISVALEINRVHELNIAHRDIKPENMIINEVSTNLLGFESNLIDFGFAELNLSTPPSNYRVTMGYFPAKTAHDWRHYPKGMQDCFALSRILYFPEQYNHTTKINGQPSGETCLKQRTANDYSIFSTQHIHDNPRLKSYLDQLENITELTIYDALLIAKELTYLRCGLSKTSQSLIVNVKDILVANILFTKKIEINQANLEFFALIETQLVTRSKEELEAHQALASPKHQEKAPIPSLIPLCKRSIDEDEPAASLRTSVSSKSISPRQSDDFIPKRSKTSVNSRHSLTLFYQPDEFEENLLPDDNSRARSPKPSN